MAVEQNAVLTVPFNGSCQHAAFGVLAARCQVFHGVFVVNAGHILFNDRSFIQISGHVVGGRTNYFYAALVRLVVGLGTFKAGQHAVVNIDGPAG